MYGSTWLRCGAFGELWFSFTRGHVLVPTTPQVMFNGERKEIYIFVEGVAY